MQRGYDNLNRLTSVQDWLGHTTSFSYDKNSNLTDIVYPTSNTVGVHYSYDSANQLTSVVARTNAQATPTPFWTFSYTRDGNGQVKSASDPVQGSTQHTYGRNTLDQLTSDQAAAGASPTVTTGYGYDSASRITSQSSSATGAVSTYTPDNADQLTGLTTTKSGSTTQHLTLGYNGNGDRTSQSDSISGSSRSYSYDQHPEPQCAIDEHAFVFVL